ncbi:cancer-associated gene 1 protein-like [Maniola hyperantus]|uniref:cancer-associated gene 1 protein-like n=1 Tax=Aphantopus hyperantus TaxID=2795564 RepID=UPI001567FC31|nr:interaptin-like [Maniola hyperantus]
MNFRRIISKSSLRSTTSSRNNLNKIDDIKKLQDEIESLKLNTSSLKYLLENRDVAIGNLAREKEKLYVELKSLQRTNRNLQQELVDERQIHSKEKEFLLDNMKRLSLKLANSGKADAVFDDEEHISALQNEIKAKDEVIYNVCSKYFKLKKSKEELQKKFVGLQSHTEETFETIVTSLEDNKNSLDLLLDELRESAKMDPSHKKYIKLLKINADLNFENTQLKMFLIAKNEFKSSGVKEKVKACRKAVPQCSQTKDQIDAHKILQRQKSTYSVENVCRQIKSSTCKVTGVFSKLKNINAFSKHTKKIRYRSMSDSLLPRDFYK